MTNSVLTRMGAVWLTAVFTLGTSVTGLAAGESAPAPATSLLASGRAYVQQLSTAAPAVPPARATQQTTGGYDEPRAFFTTKRGVALLVAAAAGIGYMWYSKSHDRIHSTARARLDN